MAKSTKTKYAVLGMLSFGPSSGYDIKKAMEMSTNHFWREGDGSIYPILKQLLDEGLVTLQLANAESDKPKKVYSISSDGQRELEDWLSEDPVLLPQRNELLLKVFFGGNVDKTVTIQHIQQYKNICLSLQNKYQTIEKSHFSGKLEDAKIFQYLTLKAGIMHSMAGIEWCNEALRILKP